MRIVRTKSGARIHQGDVILSEILNRPGATNSLFDVLGACAAMLAPGPRMALLGFAGGGLIAPLRAMGYGHPIEAVDLTRAGEAIFRELSGPWAGQVRLTRAEASRWLRRQKKRYDFILEDLSCDGDDGVTKPRVSLDVLPRLMRTRLRPGGVALFNLLPVAGRSWRDLIAQVSAPFAHARVVVLDDWENRLVLAGRQLQSSAWISRRIKHALRIIGSSEADGVCVRTLKPR